MQSQMGKMKWFLKMAGTTLVAAAMTAFAENPGNTLVIRLENVRAAKGAIWVAAYDSAENFMVEAKAVGRKFAADKTGTLELKMEGLKFGSQALAIFHDLDGNGRLNTNFFGIPTEPFAFSQKPPSKFRAPIFEEVQFDFRQSGQVLVARLERW
jgi:uncharacterized protein (DUF2141 family)